MKKLARKIRNSLNKREIIRSEGKCRKCNSRHELTVDHILPIHLGGTNDRDNLQVLCKQCHTKKDNFVIYGPR